MEKLDFEQCTKRRLLYLTKKFYKDVKRLIRQKIELREKNNKAKEIIEELYDAIPASHSDYYKDVMEKAKQFLWGKE